MPFDGGPDVLVLAYIMNVDEIGAFVILYHAHEDQPSSPLSSLTAVAEN